MGKSCRGVVSQVMGPVVDISFEGGKLPDIMNAVEIEIEGQSIIAEVARHIGDETVRCIAMQATDAKKYNNQQY